MGIYEQSKPANQQSTINNQQSTINQHSVGNWLCSLYKNIILATHV